jgi:hypothetical protein
MNVSEHRFNAEIEIAVLKARYEEHEKYSERQFASIFDSLEKVSKRMEKMESLIWKLIVASAAGSGLATGVIKFMGG